MNGFGMTAAIVVLVLVTTRYMTGNSRKNPSAQIEDGMRVLQNKRIGIMAMVVMIVIGLMVCGLGVLCFADIGFGQGGVVVLFFALGIGLILLGFLFRRLSNRNRVCFDEERVIRYHPFLKPVEIRWDEVTSYSCNPMKTFIATGDGRKITIDYTFSGVQELVERIQQLD